MIILGMSTLVEHPRLHISEAGQSDELAPLAGGDVIRFGEVLVRYSAPAQAASNGRAAQGLAVLRPAGVLDRSNYQSLIEAALAASNAGARHLIVDLSDVARIGTTGLVAVHAVAQIAQGAEPPDLETGWAAIRALAEQRVSTRQLDVVSPRQSICQALARSPLSDLLVVHPDLDSALAALAA